MATEIQILINGSALDLVIDEGNNFFLTKETYNLSDLETRDSDYTPTFNIPATPNNLVLLGDQAPLKARFSTQPTGFIDCQLLVNGVPLLQNAVILVGTQTGDNISITVFGGVTRFFSALPDASIKDLDFSEYDLNWTLTNVEALKDATDGICVPYNQWLTLDGQRYMLQEWTQDEYFTNYEIGEGGFFIYLKTVLNKIFDSIGYTLDVSPIVGDDRYQGGAIACPVDQLHEQRTQSFGESSEVYSANQFSYPNGSTKIAFDAVEKDTNNWWEAIDNNYDLPSGTFGVSSVLNGSSNANSDEIYIEIWRFTFPDASPTLLFSQQIDIPSNKNWTIDVNELVTVPNGGDLWLEVNCVTGSTNISANSTFIVNRLAQSVDVAVTIADKLPDITQKDFVKEVFKLFNIIPTQFDRTIILNYFDNKDKATALQLDLDVSKEVKVLSGFPSYGQINNMKYTDADLERTDVNSYFPVNSAVLTQEVDKIVSQFSASDDSLFSVDNITCPNYEISQEYSGLGYPQSNSGGITAVITFFNDPPDIIAGDYLYLYGPGISGGVKQKARVIAVALNSFGYFDVLTDFTFTSINEVFARRIRLSLDKLSTSRLAILAYKENINVNYTDGSQLIDVVSGNVATFDFMQWDHLKDDYYSILVRSLEKPFIIQAWAFINLEEMIGINGLRPTYIKEYDAYFYINKVEQWKVTGLARLELIKLDI